MFLSLGGIFPLRYGGPPVVAYNLINEFDKKGLEVDLVFGISETHSIEKNLHDILGFSKNVNLIPVIKNRRSPTSYNTPFGQEFLMDTIILMKKLNNRLDLIHFNHIPSSSDLLLPIVAWLKRIPTVVNIHGLLTYELRIQRDLSVYPDIFLLKLFKKRFTKIVFNSEFMKRSNRTIFDIKPEQIEVLPNGINLRSFQSATSANLIGDPRLLYVGRLEHSKGINMLVRSMMRIVDLLPNAVLHVVGDGSLMKPLKDFVNRKALGENIIFHGYISSNLASFYRSADICIVPSVFEAFGITIVEAMAAGKPIIVTKFGAIPEIVQDYKNGLLIEPSETNIVNSISTLWNNKTLMNKISQNNLVEAERYDWEQVAQKYIELYERII